MTCSIIRTLISVPFSFSMKVQCRRVWTEARVSPHLLYYSIDEFSIRIVVEVILMLRILFAKQEANSLR